MRDGKRCAAVVLAAGRGSRMQSELPKQYMELAGKPVLCYCLETLQESFVDEIVLVISEADRDRVQREIVERYGFKKVTRLVNGGAQRYHSVHAGLEAVETADVVMIHDGARPFLTQEILARLFADVCLYGSAIAAVPSKDTVKFTNERGFVVSTPDRSLVWQMQTPQAFLFAPIRTAYRELIEQERELLARGIRITDDAMVLELFTDLPVKCTEADYHNIKITTPEDLIIGEAFLKETGGR